MMEGKPRRFPNSISLQDLRTISAPADIESATSSLDFGESPRGTGSKGGFNINSIRAQLANTRLVWRITAGILLVCSVVLLVYLGFLLGRSLWSPGEEPMHFAIVVDCGSTSTRVYVYGWIRNGRSIPVMYKPPSHSSNNNWLPGDSKPKKAYNRMETEPGFHQLLHNETGLASAVEPLLDWAMQQIPARSHGETPLFLLGTAGLRKLPVQDSEWLLDKAWNIIRKSPFKCRRSWLRIITGVEEAYYGWVALNYNVERLGGDESRMRLATVGSLDLGGSSLEVTFEPEERILEGYGVNLSFGRREHRIYAYSHPGFGLNDAFDKSVALLMQSSENFTSRNGTLELLHPCLHSGYQQEYSCSSYCVVPPVTSDGGGGGVRMELVGMPSWGKCQALARSVINASRFSQRSPECERFNCALGKYQPRPTGEFYAVAGFYVMYKFFGLSSQASLDDLLRKGMEFCEKPWPAARDSVEPQGYIDRYCFRAPYVVALLREGLQLRDEEVRIGPGDITWTQGAALLETGVLERTTPSPGWYQKPAAVVSALFVLLVLLLGVIFSRWWRRQSSPYSSLLPFDAKPGTGNGSSRGWHLNLVRRGVKSPQSPAPAMSPAKDLFQDSLQASQANIPLMLDNDLLRLPPAVPHAVGRAPQHHLQPKGGSRLQSRRTPSKEDLIMIPH